MNGPAQSRDEPGDAGFTMVEVLTALAVIGTVLTAVTTFFVQSMVTVDVQGSRQVAVSLAEDAMAGLRAVTPTSKVESWVRAQTGKPDLVIGGIRYERTWSLAEPGADALPDTVEATVEVRWWERGCEGRCVYRAATLISVGTNEPVFEAAS